MKYTALNMQNKNDIQKNSFKTAISLGKWKNSRVNHLYWSAVSTPNNDGIATLALVSSMNRRNNELRNIFTNTSKIVMYFTLL